MLLWHGRTRRSVRYVQSFIAAVILLKLLWWTGSVHRPTKREHSTDLSSKFPLTWEHIHSLNRTGGAWYIPPEWIGDNETAPRTIFDAAVLASKTAASQGNRQIPFSTIPLIVHQTAASTNINTWNSKTLPWIEKWLRYAVHPQDNNQPMAYFFWDNNGMYDFMNKLESEMYPDISSLFAPVEQTDIFRILLCKWIGGVYADVDTEPLRHPATWIGLSDTASWTDDQTGSVYGLDTQIPMPYIDRSRPIRLLVGLEADTDPAKNTYWRMGYSYPVQLTQWALASAPRHPILSDFVRNLKSLIQELKNSKSPQQELSKVDPLVRTGPVAVTTAAISWLEGVVEGFRWNAVTGLKDGGKSKLIFDVLVLPITAFSPGRTGYGKMGSKPASDADARLFHHALGSWKHYDVVAEYGKFCRTFFALCKDWPKHSS